MLRCLRTYKLPLCDMITVYTGYIRPILEYGVPVFNAGLTINQCQLLEHIQKRACKIMLGNLYTTYEAALEMCSLQTLENRRKKLCLDFAKALEKNPLCNGWLPVKQNPNYSLRRKNKYRQFLCKTARFQNSALPYIVKLLNE